MTKEKITISREDLVIAASNASSKVSLKMMEKTNKETVRIVANMFGMLFTAELIRELFDLEIESDGRSETD